VDLSLDWRVLAFTAGLAAVTCLLFGLAPALRASRTDLGLVLKAAGGHGATEGRGRFAARRLLVVAQVALSFLLLVCAFLFARTLQNVASVELGFDQRGVLVASVDLQPARLPVERRLTIPDELLARVRAVPGVEVAGAAGAMPLSD